MRTLSRVALIAATLLSLVSILPASVSIHVDEIGVKGWRKSGTTPIRFTVSNDGPPATLNLRMTLYRGDPKFMGDSYSEQLTIPSGATEFRRWLQADPFETVNLALTNGGEVLAETSSSQAVNSTIRGHLIAIYMTSDTRQKSEHNSSRQKIDLSSVVKAARQSTDIETRLKKDRELDFVELSNLESDPWYYSALDALVIAEPIQASDAGKKALELYVRGGGTLIVVPQTAASTGMAAGYFRVGETSSMGLGSIVTVSGFNDDSFSKATDRAMRGGKSENTVLARAAWRMSFPSMKAMLSVTLVYILLIGVLNFAVLRRVGRLELGWITVPAIALVFSAGVYAVSLSRGVDKVRVDEASTYYMDSKSALACVVEELRITAPSRGDLTLQLSPGTVLAGRTWRNREDPHIGEAITGEERLRSLRSWRFTRQADRLSIELPMMRWSFEEWKGSRFESQPGTIQLVGDRVENLTGENFSRAMVFVRNGDHREYYGLGGLSSNGSAQLGALLVLPPEVNQWNRRKNSEIDVRDLADLAEGTKTFVGITSQGGRSLANVTGKASETIRYRVYVVELE